MRRVTLTTFFIFFVLSTLSFFPARSYAKPIGGVKSDAIAIQPHFSKDNDFIRSWITYEASPGSIIHDAIDISNLTDDEITVTLDTVDALNSDKDNFVLKQPNEKKENIGKWIILDSKNPVILPPRAELTVPVKILVPESVSSGSYWGAITIEETDASLTRRIARPKISHVLIKMRLGIRVLVKVTPKEGVARLLLASVPNIKPPPSDYHSLFANLPFWKKTSAILISSYIFGIIFWWISGHLKKHKKIHPRFHRWIFPFRISVLLGFIVFLSTYMFVFAQPGGLTISPAPTIDEKKGRVLDRPSWFLFSGDPGKVLHGKAIVTNLNDTPTEALVYPVDATVTDQGGFALQPEETERIHIGKWISLSRSRMLLRPSESKEIDFTLSIPKEVEPGDYAGGIVIQNAPKKEDGLEHERGVNIQTRIGARVYLTVLGEKTIKSESSQFTLDKREDGTLGFSFSMVNTGNARFRPSVEFILMRPDGKIVDTYTIKEAGELQPKNSAKFTLDLPWKQKDLRFGRYVVVTKISNGTDLIENRTSFTVMPPFYVIGIVAGAIVLLVFLLWFFIRKKRKEIPSPTSAQTQSNIPLKQL